jgi:hypothetical protein
MKTAIKTLAMAFLFLLGLVNDVLAGNKPTDTSDFVINGLIIQTNKKMNQKCKLELFYENKVIDSSIVKLNKPFEFKLKKNVWYTIRVTKEGFVPLLISFNTELGQNDIVENNSFAFETELIDIDQSKFLDRDLIDFPVGLVSYNKNNRKFEARDLYTQNYISGLFNSNTKNIDIVKEYVTKRDVINHMC